MQCAVVEFARNVLGINDAESSEINENSKNPVISMMEEQKKIKNKPLDILIDRTVSKKDEEAMFRLSDSIQTAFFEGEWVCNIEVLGA